MDQATHTNNSEQRPASVRITLSSPKPHRVVMTPELIEHNKIVREDAACCGDFPSYAELMTATNALGVPPAKT